MGHDPRKAGPAPASVPAGSMRMPPTAADTQLPPWGGSDVATRLAWCEAQIRGLVATVRGAQPHDCWAAVFPPDPDEQPGGTLRANLTSLLEAWVLRQRDYLSEHNHTSGQANRAALRGKHEEAGLCHANLAEVLAWPDPPSTPVQQAVDEQAKQVAACVVDLIEAWEANAVQADREAAEAASGMARHRRGSDEYHHLHVLKAQAEAEAITWRGAADALRTGGVA